MGAQRVFGACLGLMALAGVLLAAQVTLRLSVDDPSGSFIPNLRPENFVVYENGIRQSGVTVDVEHAPVTLTVLLEGGGRYQQLNKLLVTEIPYVARPLVELLKSDDTVAVFSYSEGVRTLFDFNHPNGKFEALFDALPEPVYSEAKMYDAVVAQAERSRTPIYVIGLSDMVLSMLAAEGPLAKIDWKRSDEQLKTLSK